METIDVIQPFPTLDNILNLNLEFIFRYEGEKLLNLTSKDERVKAQRLLDLHPDTDRALDSVSSIRGQSLHLRRLCVIKAATCLACPLCSIDEKYGTCRDSACSGNPRATSNPMRHRLTIHSENTTIATLPTTRVEEEGRTPVFQYYPSKTSTTASSGSLKKKNFAFFPLFNVTFVNSRVTGIASSFIRV